MTKLRTCIAIGDFTASDELVCVSRNADRANRIASKLLGDTGAERIHATTLLSVPLTGDLFAFR